MITDDSNFLDSDIDDKIVTEVEDLNIEAVKDSNELENLYILPLSRKPFFPGMAAPIIIEQGHFYEVLKKIASSKHRLIGLFMTKKEDLDPKEAKYKDLHKIGVLAHIIRIIPIKNGGAQIVVSMESRIKLISKIDDEEYIRAKALIHEDNEVDKKSKEVKAYSISIISIIKKLLKVNPLFQEELQIFLGHSDFTEPTKLADFAVALTTASREELQDILSTLKLQDRMKSALGLLKKELSISKLQNNINKKIETRLSDAQREFFLREQLKTIRKELGMEKDENSTDIEKFQERIDQRDVPDDIMMIIEEEIDKLQSLEFQSPEYSVCRSYLDWLTVIPWGIKSLDTPLLKKAEKILEEDHYGLEDIKKRILEFISVGKLSDGIKGGIICLVGPPGVGKTSIGKSIARSLGREFFRFSVGGMRDEAEIKGHRRTYVGAMPGKIIQALKVCKTMNPVIMIDEIDKLSNSFHGDPASALLEVLDPEQNKSFLDHYLDARCDLSNILFVVTANILDTIPEPLLDRMEVLRLPGYIMEEKLQIAKKYLIPNKRKEMGLKATQIKFSELAIKHIIDDYAREAGVRSLENLIKKIMRKIVMKIVQTEESTENNNSKIKKYNISASNLEEYLDKPLFDSEKYYKAPPVGVAMGLAWTSLGGTTLYIESLSTPSDKPSLKLTGQAGDVMRESSEIAWSYLQKNISSLVDGQTFLKEEQVHMHIPEGATPKDGPSAGITMVTSLISLITSTPINPDLAMTGELTLTGRVLAIGGLKEKLIAAKRAKMGTIIIPKDNYSNLDKIPDHIKEGLKIHMVEYYPEVIKIAFNNGFNKK